MFPILAGSNPSGYNLTRSLRFRASASAYLNRTPASATNRKTWTWSGWFKRGALGAGYLFGATSDSWNVNWTLIYFNSSNSLFVQDYATSQRFNLNPTMVFRDPSAWYHLVVAMDTTQATASDRIKIYVNGTQVTAFSTASYPSQNLDTFVDNTVSHQISGTGGYFDGYLAEVNFIDGQALTPSSFGSTNALTGVWQPARYTGTYGTNGFYLPFTDNSALTTSSNVGLGRDYSGNGNYWTTNNISITAGATYDSMTDVPTLTDASTANYAVINPIVASANNTVSNGNLTYVGTAAGNRTITLTGAFKQYGEITIGTGSQSVFGLATPTADLTQNTGVTSNGLYGIYDNGSGFFLFSNGTTLASIGTQTSAGVVFQLAYDAVGGKLWIGRNNVWFNSSLGTTGDPSAGTNPTLSGLAANLFMFVGTGNFATITYNCNFGQRPFTYTPPTGFVALNTYNLPDSTIVKGNTVMDATLYTGNGSTQTITNAAGFKPDLVWAKTRSSGSFGHALFDSVRGAPRRLASNLTEAENTTGSFGQVSSFNSDGFTVATGSSSFGETGLNALTYVGWQWQAGQGTTSTNTSGSITSSVSVNASAGFSIVSYTGTGSNATVGHGLGVAPQFIITKNRSATSAWHCYVAAISNMQNGYIVLNSSAAFSTSTNTVWNGTQPTSSVFSIGTDSGVNGNGNSEIAYCFTPIAGYSAFGTYTGNGSSDGPFVYTGFRPKFVLYKRVFTSGSWGILDATRNPYNSTGKYLYPNASDAEFDGDSSYPWDFLSNGFKIRHTGASENASGSAYIYMAFAENPFKNALAR